MRGAVKKRGRGEYWNEKCLVNKSEISEAWRVTRVWGGAVYCNPLLCNSRARSLLRTVEWSRMGGPGYEVVVFTKEHFDLTGCVVAAV